MGIPTGKDEKWQTCKLRPEKLGKAAYLMHVYECQEFGYVVPKMDKLRFFQVGEKTNKKCYLWKN